MPLREGVTGPCRRRWGREAPRWSGAGGGSRQRLSRWRDLCFVLLQMARTQKNKATAHHLGLLKARLAKLRRELITPKGGGGGGPGEGALFCGTAPAASLASAEVAAPNCRSVRRVTEIDPTGTAPVRFSRVRLSAE